MRLGRFLQCTRHLNPFTILYVYLGYLLENYRGDRCAFEETQEGHDDESCRQAAAHRQQPGGFSFFRGWARGRARCV